MIKVLHVSTECFPAAKAGGMGDVVGSIPLFSLELGIKASVIIPKYANEWFRQRKFSLLYKGGFNVEGHYQEFMVFKLTEKHLSFPFYCIELKGLFDRESIYLDTNGEGYSDEVDRNFSFQRAVLLWLKANNPFDIIHCHDHQTALIPFFMQYGHEFQSLVNTASFYTIHNAAYKGMWYWDNKSKLPPYQEAHSGLLDWDEHIHSYASALRCAWAFNTVSPNYLHELKESSGNMGWLFETAKDRSFGILNGIDMKTWNPRNDSVLPYSLTNNWARFKERNKSAFCVKYKLEKNFPLMSFIGRLSDQKGCDIIASVVERIAQQKNICFAILGSGDKSLENKLVSVALRFPNKIATIIKYDESLAHEIYAASDFLLMPSRFEPCGLNQMIAMRYGTVPIVTETGGLKDTVVDIEKGGCGITLFQAEEDQLYKAIQRAYKLFKSTEKFKTIRKKCSSKDFSWNKSIEKYKSAYLKILNR